MKLFLKDGGSITILSLGISALPLLYLALNIEKLSDFSVVMILVATFILGLLCVNCLKPAIQKLVKWLNAYEGSFKNLVIFILNSLYVICIILALLVFLNREY